MNHNDSYPEFKNTSADHFLTEEDHLMNRDLASPEYAVWCAKSELLRVLELMKHLYPETLLQSKAQLAFDLVCSIDKDLESS